MLFGKAQPKQFFLIAAFLGLSGCIFEEDRSGAGFQDGLAVGYNTACEVRASLINAEWDNESYSRAYADGVTQGILQCLADKKAGRI